jgi:hypothetical protein
MKETLYHVYFKDECIYHSLSESEFKEKWQELNRLAELLTNQSLLSYEEIQYNKEIILNSSH